jgi:SAM-dependent methyltransferase
MITERLTFGLDSQDNISLHKSRYIFAGEYVKDKYVLDIACGNGYGTEILRSAGATKVIGVDIASSAIDYAKSKYEAKGLSFKIGDAQKFKYTQMFDTIVSFETIEHLNDPHKFLSSVIDNLRSDGLFIVSTPIRVSGNLLDKPRNPFHVREWDENEFNQLLMKYFSSVQLYHQYSFCKSNYPFSRTIKQFISRIIFSEFNDIYERHPVLKEPIPQKLFSIIPVYMIAVCKRSGINVT